MADVEVKTASSKLNDYMEKNRKSFIAVAVALAVAIIVFVVVSVVMNNAKIKAITAIDEITYELTDGSTTLEEAEINTRCEAALDKVKAYTGKGGIVGARANMLVADITYNMKKYSESAEYWKAVADKGKKTYLAPIAMFNLGVCNEELNNLEYFKRDIFSIKNDDSIKT